MTAKPKHFWPRFTLRTLFVVVGTLAIPLAWLASEASYARQRLRERDRLCELGGSINRNGESLHIWPKWRLRLHLLYDDSEISSLHVPEGTDQAEIERLGGYFRRLEFGWEVIARADLFGHWIRGE